MPNFEGEKGDKDPCSTPPVENIPLMTNLLSHLENNVNMIYSFRKLFIACLCVLYPTYQPDEVIYVALYAPMHDKQGGVFNVVIQLVFNKDRLLIHKVFQNEIFG